MLKRTRGTEPDFLRNGFATPHNIRLSEFVPERQLRLFEQHPKPLLERFGKEFFKQIPRTPGVYLMHGESGKTLYVGQSKNLRSRLNSYKNAHPDHVSRKTIRLVHQVRSIRWEECGTPEKARLRENELLRTLRPRFNRMNTFPKAHCFIGLKVLPERFLFTLTRQEVSGTDFFGAFKSGAAYGYQALLRLLWAALYAPESMTHYPRPLLLPRPPSFFELPLPTQDLWHGSGTHQLPRRFFPRDLM